MTLLNQLEGVLFTILYDLGYHNLFCYTMLCVLSSRCDVCCPVAYLYHLNT